MAEWITVKVPSSTFQEMLRQRPLSKTVNEMVRDLVIEAYPVPAEELEADSPVSVTVGRGEALENPLAPPAAEAILEAGDGPGEAATVDGSGGGS